MTFRSKSLSGELITRCLCGVFSDASTEVCGLLGKKNPHFFKQLNGVEMLEVIIKKNVDKEADEDLKFQFSIYWHNLVTGRGLVLFASPIKNNKKQSFRYWYQEPNNLIEIAELKQIPIRGHMLPAYVIAE